MEINERRSRLKALLKNPWHYIWVAILMALPLTYLMNFTQSLFWYGHVDHELLVIGSIDAVVVPLIVAPCVIYFVVAERRQHEQRLLELSLTDELTGVNNRRGFFALARQQLKVAHRQGEGFYILYADVDRFKSINDRLGHMEGDRILSEVAGILKDNCRETDIIGRFGGDEFVILPVGTSDDGVDIIFERFRKVFATLTDKNGAPITLSFGVAWFDPANPAALEELIDTADKFMYEQKKRQKAFACVN